MPRITITVSDELNTWLKQQAKAKGRSKSGQAAWLLLAIKRNSETIADYTKYTHRARVRRVE